MLKQKDKQNESKCLNFAFKLARLLPIAMSDLSEAISELVDEDVLQIAGDELQQKRMIKDNALSLIRAKAGSKGGKKRSFAIAKTQANTEDESEDESESEFAVDKYNEGFDAFWNLYPKKQGKGACKKIWKKIKVSGELLNIVLAAVEKQKQSKQWTKENGQFIPMPATWLNQERWDDEITENGFAGQDRYLNAMITEEDLNGSK